MAEHQFFPGKKHLPARAATIARRHNADLVNFIDPVTQERRHWFTRPAADPMQEAALKAELLAAGIRVDRAR